MDLINYCIYCKRPLEDKSLEGQYHQECHKDVIAYNERKSNDFIVLKELKKFIQQRISSNNTKFLGERCQYAAFFPTADNPELIAQLGKNEYINSIVFMYCDFSSDNLEKLFSFLTSFIFLQNLGFVNCNIDNIPESIKELKYLNELRFESTHLPEIPNAIIEMNKLRSLIIHESDLEIIHDNIDQLTELQKLILNGNKIKRIPFTICNLTKLKILDLTFNRLEDIPDRLLCMDYLLEINERKIFLIEGNEQTLKLKEIRGI